jgi:hypothetical protein
VDGIRASPEDGSVSQAVKDDPSLTLGEVVERMGLGEWFKRYYLLPMGGAIWSCPPKQMLAFPARVFADFFDNHGLLSMSGQPQWRTVDEGSQQYVDKLVAPFRERVRVGCGAARITRGADGVHVGQEDLASTSLKRIRKIIGKDAVLGVTCHASRHLAMEAGEEEADYVAFGAFYPTTSKPKEKLEKWGTPTPELLEWWSEQSTLPCVAIGGITPQNLAPLVQAGADFVAVITGIWNHPQGAGAGVKAYNAAIACVA